MLDIESVSGGSLQKSPDTGKSLFAVEKKLSIIAFS